MLSKLLINFLPTLCICSEKYWEFKRSLYLHPTTRNQMLFCFLCHKKAGWQCLGTKRATGDPLVSKCFYHNLTKKYWTSVGNRYCGYLCNPKTTVGRSVTHMDCGDASASKNGLLYYIMYFCIFVSFLYFWQERKELLEIHWCQNDQNV